MLENVLDPLPIVERDQWLLTRRQRLVERWGSLIGWVWSVAGIGVVLFLLGNWITGEELLHPLEYLLCVLVYLVGGVGGFFYWRRERRDARRSGLMITSLEVIINRPPHSQNFKLSEVVGFQTKAEEDTVFTVQLKLKDGEEIDIPSLSHKQRFSRERAIRRVDLLIGDLNALVPNAFLSAVGSPGSKRLPSLVQAHKQPTDPLIHSGVSETRKRAGAVALGISLVFALAALAALLENL